MRSSKVLVLILALVFVLAIAVACGDNGEPAATPTPAPPVVVEPDNNDTTGDAPDLTQVEVEPEEVVLEPIPRAPGLIYSFSTDAFFQNADQGTTGMDYVIGGSDYLQQAGNPSWTVVEGPNGNAIRLSQRQNHWDSLDIETSAFDWDPANNQYLLTVIGRLDEGATMRINGADGPYTVYDYVELEQGGRFTLSTVIDADAIAVMGGRQRIRVQAYPETVDIYIYDVSVTNYFPRAEGVVYSLSSDPFVQSLNIGVVGVANVLASPNIGQAGNPTWTSIEGPYGVAIQNSNREANWNALDIETPTLNWDLENNTYLLTVRGHIASGGTAVIGGADGPHTHFVEVETDDNGYFEMSLLLDEEQVAAMGSRRWIRILSTCTNVMQIHEITIAVQ
ncbi:MAG: hypothetical protein FWC89_02455 [Defluviitaleaceae bacterium]|nr:hypothetical protein [Defluviitaleaceae bacterium]